MKEGVSVVVCCYNGAQRIRETLRYLALQKTKSTLAWEVLLVDNGSTDETARIATDSWNEMKSIINLRVISEQRQGLSYARATGVKNSLYDIIVFCDDDNWLFEDYVQLAFDIMVNDAKLGAAGGEGIVKSDRPLPSWFDAYKGYFACYPQAAKSGELTHANAFLYGAGLVVRKQAIELLNQHDVKFLLTDRSASNLVSGGDTELCYLLRLCNYKLWYDDRLKFFHFMPHQRLSLDYLQKLITAISYSTMTLAVYDYVLSSKALTRMTWFSDVAYRIYYLCRSLMLAPVTPDKFLRRVSISSSWSSLHAILDMFGRYDEVYQRLNQLQQLHQSRPTK